MNKQIRAGSVALLLTAGLLLPGAAGGQTPARKQDAPLTKEQGDAILNELKAIHQLLEKGARPESTAPAAQAAEPAVAAKLKLEGGYSLGAKDAPVTMVEYTDYQCPFCRQFHQATFAEIRKKYIDTGKVRFVSRDLPLDFHNNAFKAAEAARCAGEQNQYWRMRDVLVANATKLAPDDILGYAQDIYLDMTAFRACASSGRFKQAIEKDAAEAGRLNISGTPSFVIGKTTAEGVDGTVVVGAQPLAVFEARFKELESPSKVEVARPSPSH